MIINDLLKKYNAKFNIEFNGEKNEINPEILNEAVVIKNNNKEFILHVSREDGSLFELIVKSPNTVIYNDYTPDGDIFHSNSYSNEGIMLS